MLALLLANTLVFGEEKNRTDVEESILKALELHQSIEMVHEIKIDPNEEVALIITEEKVKIENEGDAPFAPVLTILEKMEDTWQVQGSNSDILLRYVRAEIPLVKQLESVNVQIEHSTENKPLIQLTYVYEYEKDENGEGYQEKVTLSKGDEGKWHVVQYSTYDSVYSEKWPVRKMTMGFDPDKKGEVSITIENAIMPYPETMNFPMEFETFKMDEAYSELLELSWPFSNG